MKKIYLKDKAEFLKMNKGCKTEVFTEEIIKCLPEVLKKYLRVCNYINTPIPFNANVYWAYSWLKLSPKKDWGKLHTMQFNSVQPIGRVAYMKFLYMPIAARDIYRGGYGEVNGKLLNCIQVVFDNSKETAQSALITVFCEFMFVPGYLLLDNVKWEQIDENSVRGKLSDNGFIVTGIFRFNDEGLFTHFETDDRYYSVGKGTYQKVRFSAIVDSYKLQDNIKICQEVKAIWHLPEGDFEYYKGTIDKVEFNVFE